MKMLKKKRKEKPTEKLHLAIHGRPDLKKNCVEEQAGRMAPKSNVVIARQEEEQKVVDFYFDLHFKQLCINSVRKDDIQSKNDLSNYCQKKILQQVFDATRENKEAPFEKDNECLTAKFIIKGIPLDYDIEEVKQEIQEVHGIKVVSCKQMFKGTRRLPTIQLLVREEYKTTIEDIQHLLNRKVNIEHFQTKPKNVKNRKNGLIM